MLVDSGIMDDQDGNELPLDIKDEIIPSSLDENDEAGELRILLESWNQEKLFSHLVAQNVFVEVLKVIKPHHLEKVLNTFDMGTQIMFEHKLEEWRRSLELPLSLNQDSGDNFSMNSSNPPLPHPPSSYQETPRRLSQESRSSTPYDRPSSPDNYISLTKILNETPKGRMITEYYKKYLKFQDEQRLALINMIAHYYEENKNKMTLAVSHRLEIEIIKKFPNEKLEYYRTSKRGKIYNKFNNLKSTFKAAISNHISERTGQKEDKSVKNSRHLKEFVPEEDADSCVRALKFDNLCSQDFNSYWKACSHYRLEQIKKSTSTADILEKWAFYKMPSGFRLIDVDFEISFGNGNGFLNKWQDCSGHIFSFLMENGHVKDRKLKGILGTINSENNISENSRNALILWALHGYFAPINKIVKKDTLGKRKTIKFGIIDSQESFMILRKSLEDIEEHIRQLKMRNTAIRPFIFCIGDNIFKIKETYVYFDDIKYKMLHFTRATDICFKIIYLFNLDFPLASAMFYNCLETYFYNFKSKNVYSKVHILSEYLNNKTKK